MHMYIYIYIYIYIYTYSKVKTLHNVVHIKWFENTCHMYLLKAFQYDAIFTEVLSYIDYGGDSICIYRNKYCNFISRVDLGENLS